MRQKVVNQHKLLLMDSLLPDNLKSCYISGLFTYTSPDSVANLKVIYIFDRQKWKMPTCWRYYYCTTFLLRFLHTDQVTMPVVIWKYSMHLFFLEESIWQEVYSMWKKGYSRHPFTNFPIFCLGVRILILQLGFEVQNWWWKGTGWLQSPTSPWA